MRILLVSSDNSRTSGAFLCMAQLAKHLKHDLNHDVKIVVPFDGNGSELLNELNIDYDIVYSPDWVVPVFYKHPLKFAKKFFKFLTSSKAANCIEQYLKDFKPDVVHINTSWCYLFGHVSMKLGFPVVWQIQEFLNEDQGMHFINRKFAIETLKKANYVATISNAIDSKYRLLGLTNTEVVVDGIDVSKYFVSDHTLFNDDRIVFLFVGGVGRNKGQFEIVEWLGKMFKRKELPTNFELRIAGFCSKKYKRKLIGIAKKYSIDRNLLILGPINDIVNEYRKSDIQFVNSKKEAFGRVTVEGLLGGCCLVASNTGGTLEIIKQGVNGFLYEKNSFESFEAQLLFIINNPNKTKEIVSFGQNEAKTKYDSLNNAVKFESLYKAAVRSFLKINP